MFKVGKIVYYWSTHKATSYPAIQMQTHPITKGIKDFFIIDEIWEKPDIYPGSKALASVSARDEVDGHSINESIVYINHIGKGRSFFTTLGHDEKALLNNGLKTLLLRGTQWAADQKVTIETPN